MKSGRDLDALMAEKVMGWTDVNLNGSGIPPHFKHLTSHELYPNYSTDIAAAWEVVEKLTSSEGIKLEIHPSNCFKEYEVGITFEDKDGDAMGPFYFLEKTAPHAICLAALKAVDQTNST